MNNHPRGLQVTVTINLYISLKIEVNGGKTIFYFHERSQPKRKATDKK